MRWCGSLTHCATNDEQVTFTSPAVPKAVGDKDGTLLCRTRQSLLPMLVLSKASGDMADEPYAARREGASSVQARRLHADPFVK